MGSLRFLITFPIIDEENIAYYINSDVQFVGIVDEEPVVQEKSVTYVIEVHEIKSGNEKISGKVILKSPLYPEFFYGDKLEVKCKLESPQNNMSQQSAFRYDKYLAQKNIWSVCVFPKITKLSDSENFSIMRVLLSGKKSLEHVIENLWAEPKSSFMGGLLYGNRSDLPQDLKFTIYRYLKNIPLLIKYAFYLFLDICK